MISIAEAVAHAESERERLERTKANRVGDRFKRFYSSFGWRKARYQFFAKQPRPLRCSCCGVGSEAKLVVDHIDPIKRSWARRFDEDNFQLMCTACNLGKASTDTTDWRDHSFSSA
jgi:5-methylcytosine-specific restriction endonuclease McrA